MKRTAGLAMILAMTIGLLAACGGGAKETALNGETLQRIYKAYPSLKDKKYSVAEVKRVVDGDTFETGEGDKVRLIGVNTPETVKPNSPVEKIRKGSQRFHKEEADRQNGHPVSGCRGSG